MDRPAPTLAARLREERRRRGLSLRRLAELSGLSPTTIHQIEIGRDSPRLGTLELLASTLGIPLAGLFESGPLLPEPAVLMPARGRSRPRTPAASLQWLVSGLSGRRLHALFLTLAPGEDTGPEVSSDPGHELVFVLAGRCVYGVAGKEYRLGPGDSLFVDCRQPRRGRNPGPREARPLLVLYAPGEEPSWNGAPYPRLSGDRV
jgi:HTH-type transcriptional repressor of puuD